MANRMGEPDDLGVQYCHRKLPIANQNSTIPIPLGRLTTRDGETLSDRGDGSRKRFLNTCT